MLFRSDAPPMRNEWPKVVPKPRCVSRLLRKRSAASRVRGRMFPCSSRQEKRGSCGPAGTMTARFLTASRGQRSFCGTRKTCCTSPGPAVFASGRSRRRYSLPLRSRLNRACDLVRCFEGAKLVRVRTVASPKRIRPQKAHVATAQMHASNGFLRSRDPLSDTSMGIVTGGRGGRFRRCAWRRAIPRRDQSICARSGSDSGAGQPWAICHARTADRYFDAVCTETGSSGTSLPADATLVGLGSLDRSTSAVAHRMNE